MVPNTNDHHSLDAAEDIELPSYRTLSTAPSSYRSGCTTSFSQTDRRDHRSAPSAMNAFVVPTESPTADATIINIPLMDLGEEQRDEDQGRERETPRHVKICGGLLSMARKLLACLLSPARRLHGYWTSQTEVTRAVIVALVGCVFITFGILGLIAGWTVAIALLSEARNRY
ncbi:hypothetical protein POX_d05617 [Penicillium oxalicum]|uniref:hypothetical protein n=1 Tax=Penicillium oxalicum TaxID=69781 RepID=UPI0020B8D1E9|nr:hypothetical protein POX_d05617 [Penicillium oxalicum]KAI2790112.1 hypothetical protein POX_d05617 [Penicillium oxalicum]